MTIEEASEQLAHVIEPFATSWRNAWQDLRETYSNPEWDARTRSNVLQMQAVIHSKRLFASVPGVRHFNIDNRHLFEVEGLAVFRLKQLDELHRASNYQTKTARNYAAQRQLDGLEDLPRLTVGLVPDAHWINFVGIFVTYPRSTTANNWVLDITNNEPVNNEVEAPVFAEITATQPRRWKLKQDDEQRNEGSRASGI